MNWDYLAGFFDGEACVQLTHDRKRGYCCATLTFTQNRRWVLEEIRQFLGKGHIYQGASTINGPVYQLRVRGKAVESVARELVERCRLKAPQLRVLLQAMAFKGTERRGFERLLRTLKKDLGEDGCKPPPPKSE